MFGGRRSFRWRGGRGKATRVGHVLTHHRKQRCRDAQAGYNFDVVLGDEAASTHETWWCKCAGRVVTCKLRKHGFERGHDEAL